MLRTEDFFKKLVGKVKINYSREKRKKNRGSSRLSNEKYLAGLFLDSLCTIKNVVYIV